MRLNIPLDTHVLRQSLNEVIRRHEVLRARFITVNGLPVQVIEPQLVLPLPVDDLQGHSQVEKDQQVQLLATQEARTSMDITRGPLLRARILKLAPDEHVLLLTLHHIIADGYSVGILVNETVAIYNAYLADRPVQLPELPIQYADFAAWQRQWLAPAGEILENQLSFWKKRIEGAPPTLDLPFDRFRPAVQSFNGAHINFDLPKDIYRGLKALGEAADASLFMVLLAAFQVLLHRYSGQDDFCVGTPIANRTRSEITGLIGLFVNTLVMRADFSDEHINFQNYLHQVREMCLDAFAHQDLPLERLVDELQIPRDLSRTPLFQVMFTLQEAQVGLSNLQGATEGAIRLLDIDSGTSKFDLTMFIEEGPQGLSGGIEYNTDLFEAGSIRRMIGYFQELLTGIVADPSRPVKRLPLIKEDEKRRLLVEWNRTTRPYPAERTLAESFDLQVQRTPNAIAIVDAYEITYAELNRRANQLAHYLQSFGIGPEDLVGVLLERSMEMVITTLAIVKAGGAYLPLDQSYPPERLQFMLEECQSPVIVTTSSLLPKLPATSQAGKHIICLDRDAQDINNQADTNPVCKVTTENLAYIIYTSGSTGIPKGVPIVQRSINRLVFDYQYLDYTKIGRLAHLSNPSFDAATAEIWGALLNGATLVVIPRDIALSSRAFANYLREQRIRGLFITTALFNLIAYEVPDAFAPLDVVLFGGEATDVQAVRQVLTNGSPTELYNVYGPTESTTFATCYLIKRLPDQNRLVPIGTAIANTQAYVLDPYLQPSPIGIPGELYLSGDGLARGYFERSELTRERFLPNPHAPVLNQALSSQNLWLPHDTRLYKTGDRVRLLPDGAIEFLGRMDTQVKIRGLRIELGEIETVLGQYPAIQQAITIAREDTPGEKRLVAYLVSKSGAQINISELRRYLKDKLPEFMVPAAFVKLDTIPLTPNGKVDRRALPPPDTLRPELDKAYVAPRTQVEKYITQKWQATLGLENIGIYDNFFDLGGDSLKAAVLMNRLQNELEIAAHVRALFMAPTVADLALYMGEYYPNAVGKIEALMGGSSMADGAAPDTTGAISPGEPQLVATAASAYTFQQELKTEAQLRVGSHHLELIRQIIIPLPERPAALAITKEKNPPAIFVISPPRSGSTLLRTMLGGNPKLFSPPELDLLSFNTLAERRAAFSGAHQFWLEGVIRAVMEVKGCQADQAEQIMRTFEEQGMSTKAFYGQLQAWIGDRWLVDKTPVYALDLQILRRMEEDFNQPFYIHLTRHPYASIYSFIEAKLDQVFFRYPHSFTQRELAELVWIISHQNILDFLKTVPVERQCRVSFEEMVNLPEASMRKLISFLGLEFNPEMLKPYEGQKMTSGVRPGAQMVGDFKFYLRRSIDAQAADRWKRFQVDDFLSDVGWEVAHRLGYEPESQETSLSGSAKGGDNRVALRAAPTQPIPRLDRTRLAPDALPLSYAQQRLWFLDQWEPGSPYYNIPSAIRLLGKLNITALERSLNEIVRRHEALRTVYRTVEGSPVLQIAPALVVPLPIVDLQVVPENLRESEARRLADEEARLPFNLEIGPLLRVRLIRLGREDHIFVLTMHHIIGDGWSAGVFNRELGILYEAYSSGKPSPLPELPIQYVDFAAWQREWLKGELLQKQLDYWKKKLVGGGNNNFILELPTDRPRPPVQTQHGARVHFTLPQALSEQVRALSHQAGATSFMTLLAAFYALLYRYSGQETINIGTPIANRNRAEIEGLIGFFVNTLVLRGDLSDEVNFDALLAQVKQTALEAYENQDLPFERLVDELQPNREMSHTPLFQVMFTLQDAPIQSMQNLMSGIRMQPVHADSGTAKFDLLLTMVERGDIFRGVLEYNTDLFDASTIERMTTHYQVLLESLVSTPDRPVSRAALITPQELEQIARWNRTEKTIPSVPIHRLFEEQVRRTPEALAVYYEGQTLSFTELNHRANQLARALRGAGIQPEALVGMYMERSVEMIVGLMGILKAGGGYVPLDPAYPDDRLSFILQDAQVSMILTQERLRQKLTNLHPEETQPGSKTLQILILDQEWDQAFGNESGENLEEELFPSASQGVERLAYVIYTSGSTGQPKGVLIEHRTAVNLWQGLLDSIYQHLEQPAGEQGFRISLNAPLLFDASVQMWLMLLSGCSLFIIPQDLRGDGEGLLAYLRHHRLDVIDCVPSQLKLLINAGLLENEPSVWKPKAILPGGEALDQSTWERLAHSEIEFFNMYGPTECTVDTLIGRVKDMPGRVTIGRPVVNTRAYVVDLLGQQNPVGIPGELWLAGGSVGRGYHQRAELTAEKFIKDPFEPEAVLNRGYKTGDQVRYLANGYIEYLGRIDDQVKLRGFRIELGEITANLLQHPEVKDAVVIVREDTPGEKQLVAYLVPEQKTAAPDHTVLEGTPATSEAIVDDRGSLSVNALRSHLKKNLPDYMIPAVFVPLAALPKTPNGKIDRRALPRPDANRLTSESIYVAPRTSAETILAEIWKQVLGIEQVGVYDNFFELGGDSIMSIQVIARAKKAGLNLLPRHMFEAQTVAELALKIDQVTSVNAEQGLVTGPVMFTPIQHHFFSQELPQPQHWNQALLLTICGSDGSAPHIHPDWLRQAIQALMVHHDVLRMRFQQSRVPLESGDSSEAGVPVDAWLQSTMGDEAHEIQKPPFEWIDLSSFSETEQRLRIEQYAQALQASLNLSTGPLIRIAGFDLGGKFPDGKPALPRLLFVAHHLVIDGVSWRILLEDLITAYGQLSQGQPIRLPAKTTSYKAWAEQLRAYAGSAAALQDLDFWLQAARSPATGLAYAVGEKSARENNLEGQVGSVRISLPADQTQKLLQQVLSTLRIDINDILLSALWMTFEPVMQAQEFLPTPVLKLHMEGHGREPLPGVEVDVSRTVGWFTSLYPICLRVDNRQRDPIKVLKSIRGQLDKIPKRGFDYGVLRYLSSAQQQFEEITEGSPQISFNYLGQLDNAFPQVVLSGSDEAAPDGTPASPEWIFGLAPESTGDTHHPANWREHLLDIVASVTGGQLRMEWQYGTALIERSYIERLAADYVKHLQALIDTCLSAQAADVEEISGYNSSDFSDIQLDQDDLDKLMDELGSE